MNQPARVAQVGTRRGDGRQLEPGQGVVPILHRVNDNEFDVVGTGFHLTRYGFIATAAHIIARRGENGIDDHYVLELIDGAYAMRRIVTAFMSPITDAAILQAELTGAADMHCRVTQVMPQRGDVVATYSYPLNDRWVFCEGAQLELRADYYVGQTLAVLDEAEVRRRRETGEYFNQRLPPPIVETTLAIAGGGSGSAVFNDRGNVVGFYSSGFGDGPPSYVVPVSRLLDLEVMLPANIPAHVLEARLLGTGRGPYFVHRLAQEGHFPLVT